MHISGRSGIATLEVLLNRWGRRRPGRAYTASFIITSGACRALLSTRTVSCSDSMRTTSLALNGSDPTVASCCRKPARWLLIVSRSQLDPLEQRKDGCSFGRARSMEKGGRSPAPPWCWCRAPVPCNGGRCLSAAAPRKA